MDSDNPNVWGERVTVQDYGSGYFVYEEAPTLPTTGDARPKNVILFGETGAGKSSVINLMAGREIAQVSSDMEGCTLESTEYPFALSNPEMSLRIFDTVGLEEPDMAVNAFFNAIEKAQQLMKTLHDTGGIDLLLFCVKGGRVTSAMQRNYRLFYEILCEKRVPLAMVITHLENEDVMEDWWDRNRDTFKRYQIDPVAHACVTALPARVTLYAERRAQSQRALAEMFRSALNIPRPSYSQVVLSWMVVFFQGFWSFLTGRMFFRRRDLLRRLKDRCRFSDGDAERLANVIMPGQPGHNA